MKEDIIAVRSMQKYIEKNLYDKSILDDLSRHANYSKDYCNKLFVKYLNISIKRYIRRLMLSFAALKIRDEESKITDISYELNYQSPDSFTRAFYKEFGCNPKEYAINYRPLALFSPYEVRDLEYERNWKHMECKNVFIEVVTKPARKVLIKRGKKATDYFEYCDEVGCDIWGILLSMKSSNEPVSMWLPKRLIKENTSEYVQGVEVGLDYNGIIPEGFDIIELEESTYLRFQSEKFKDEDYGIIIEETWNAIKKFDPTTLGYKWDEKQPRIQLEPLGKRGYIEYVPIKK